MGFNPRKVYEFAKSRDADGNEEYRLVRINPYISISAGGGPQVFLQEGLVYSAEGKVIPEAEWPNWLPGEIEKISPQGRAKIGFQKEGDSPAPAKDGDPRVEALERELAETKRALAQAQEGFVPVDVPPKPKSNSKGEADRAAW